MLTDFYKKFCEKLYGFVKNLAERIKKHNILKIKLSGKENPVSCHVTCHVSRAIMCVLVQYTVPIHSYVYYSKPE
jgi:Fe-S oxidoreductase